MGIHDDEEFKCIFELDLDAGCSSTCLRSRLLENKNFCVCTCTVISWFGIVQLIKEMFEFTYCIASPSNYEHAFLSSEQETRIQ